MGQLLVRSAYSLLQSTLSINRIIDACIREGYQYVALCDYQNMHGALGFYQAALAKKIKPIIGLECLATCDDKKLRFALYARDDIGYKALIKLSSTLCSEESLLSIEELAAFSSHCEVVLLSFDCEIEACISKEDSASIKSLLSACTRCFSHLYGGICNNDNGFMKSKQVLYKRILKELEIKSIAMSATYYDQEKDALAYRCLRAIDKSHDLNDKQMNIQDQRHFRSIKEMEALYDQEDLQACDELANLCNVEMKLNKASLPHFKNRYQLPSDVFLTKLCYAGLKKRLNNQVTKQYFDRLQYELSIILKMGFEDYFLIVYDFIRYAKLNHIYVGAGRGSAAGSLVAYCLGITNVDPIEYHLLFERFLNPERISLPDIDCDFPDNRREEVIEYVHKLYGDNHVAHIVTFNTFQAKLALREVGKVLKIPGKQIDILCKMVGNKAKVTLQEIYQSEANFAKMIESSKQLQQLFKIALQIEGLPKNTSIHAAGLVISDIDIDEICPLMRINDEFYVTQFPAQYLEQLGLIKMDFLGLRNLTIIDEIMNQLNQDNIEVDFKTISKNDPLTFQLIQNGDILGIFQLESEGMKNLLRKMKPTNFEDIVAAIALFRPGPMKNIPEYLKRRESNETYDTIHDDFKDILSDTYGIMIYQEQILQLAQKMAGFSYGKADLLRKAISKKHEDELVALKADFINGALAKGYEIKLAQSTYDLIMRFADYGFNRSHSVAYGMIAYHMAYLKAHYPLYFYQALLNSVLGSLQKSSEYIFEIRKRGIKLLLPSINYSSDHYLIENSGLRFPLTGIKTIDKKIVKNILDERVIRGQFVNFYDFVTRLYSNKIDQNHLKSLIYAGACDEFPYNRSTMVESLHDAINYARLVTIEDEEQLHFDYSLVSTHHMVSVEENMISRMNNEKEVLGFYLTMHPITRLRNKYLPNSVCIIQLPSYFNRVVCFIARIDKIKNHRTKRGDMMMFLTVSDETASFDLTCMPNICSKYASLLQKGNYLLIKGKIDRETSCFVQKLKGVEDYQ